MPVLSNANVEGSGAAGKFRLMTKRIARAVFLSSSDLLYLYRVVAGRDV